MDSQLIMTTAEVQEMLGLTYYATLNFLRDTGLKPVAKGKYRREDVMLVAHNDPSCRPKTLYERRLLKENDSLREEIARLKCKLYEIAALAGTGMVELTRREQAQ